MRPNLRRMNYPGSQWGSVWPTSTNFDRLPQQTPCPGVPLGYREGPWRALSSPFARLLHRLEGALHGKSAEGFEIFHETSLMSPNLWEATSPVECKDQQDLDQDLAQRPIVLVS